jgi:hypothetical protein
MDNLEERLRKLKFEQPKKQTEENLNQRLEKLKNKKSNDEVQNLIDETMDEISLENQYHPERESDDSISFESDDVTSILNDIIRNQSAENSEIEELISQIHDQIKLEKNTK